MTIQLHPLSYKAIIHYSLLQLTHGWSGRS